MRMNIRNSLTTLVMLGGICITCQAQSPLSKAFVDMKSSDPATAQRAKDSVALLTEQEMPYIERDTATLCNALNDSDPFIRLQASAVLGAIAITAPTHNQVVLSCSSGLIHAATDPEDQTRNNALFTLAMNPAGPPAEAQHVFEIALGSSNFRTAEVGAAGLLKMNGGKNEGNHKLVADALTSAPDAQHRLNILYAISGSNVPSDTLLQASQRYVSDSDPDVQSAAIDAVASAGSKDTPQVASVMQNISASSSANPETKEHAQAILKGLQTAK